MSPAVFVALIVLLVLQPQSTFVVPNFSDATIKTRVTRGLQRPMVETLQLKGPKERLETSRDSAGPTSPFHTQIWQCDESRYISLLDGIKTYRIFPIPHLGDGADRHLPPVPKHESPLVTITTDSEDTGDRRQMGSYQAKHIKTTVTVEPSKDASATASKMEVDGWYVDLPGLACHSGERNEQPPFSGWLIQSARGGHDSFKYVKIGSANVGYPVEETSTVRSENNTIINKVELIEFSDKPLDASLFEIPAGYAEAPSQTFHKVF